MDLLLELLTILITSFALNLIPFAGPSNLLIASNAAIVSTANPAIIGLLVAFGAAVAKFIHYAITFFISSHMGEQRRRRLEASAPRLRRWGSLALFIVAATPLPDEPVIIPLGLVKYNPVKFFLVFLAGKLSITIVGAYLGRIGQDLLESVISQEALMIISIVLTITVTIVLLKVDVGRLVKRILKRKIAPEP
ncbi:VTT domain-containing protein [Candidatus Bathyarchaeota archaeon]|nr:VTT domain-containing protein [Candidatus Bathyarchaeota archaeon]